MASHLSSLAYLDEANPFSIRQWVLQDQPQGREDSWLFLVALPDQREAMRSLLSTWVGVAIRSLLSLDSMSLEPNPSRRLWFIMDELPALHHLQSLPLGLAEARKYGGCFILGLQDTNQLDELYGHNIAKSILGLLNTKILFRSPDDTTAKRLSALLGEREESEIIEGLSFGAHHMRDGVSLSDQRRIKPAVSATDIMNLKDLEAYLKFPGTASVAKIKFSHVKPSPVAAPFIEKPQALPQAPKRARKKLKTIA